MSDRIRVDKLASGNIQICRMGPADSIPSFFNLEGQVVGYQDHYFAAADMVSSFPAPHGLNRMFIEGAIRDLTERRYS